MAAFVRDPQRSGHYSSADGWFVALGGTEERARYGSLGLRERPGDAPFDRLTGT